MSIQDASDCYPGARAMVKAGEPPALVRLKVYSIRRVEVPSRHALSGL